MLVHRFGKRRPSQAELHPVFTHSPHRPDPERPAPGGGSFPFRASSPQPVQTRPATTMDLMRMPPGDLGGRPARVAMISLHTSPQDPPGSGDAGGMNVYILSVANELARQGVSVDVYTRNVGPCSKS